MLRKLILISVSFILLFSIFGVINNEVEATEQVEELDLDELPIESQQFFMENGFDENDLFYKTDYVENESTASNEISTRAKGGVNVVSMVGASKKVSSTKGKVVLHLTSFRKNFKSANARVTGGGKKWTKTKIKGSGKSMGITIPVSHTGKKKYFGFRANVQYVTTAGAGNVTSSAGGLTLGK
ncbi:hypothetical protein [Mammaliicoccus vitulinus]|uniref:hypothetical protein n=1 Tax=Mammaliicoccus vitulinus TaxID=71237 RepID=UPI0028D44671|nr:hypothetical protein [Mammaliicoccus vitulinus]